MSGDDRLHTAIFDAAARRRSSDEKVCSGLTVQPGFPDNLPVHVLEHVAFCPHCRELLQRHFTGRVITAAEQEPDWQKLTRRLRRRVRWDLLVDRIREVMTVQPDLLDTLAPAAVRGPAPAGVQYNITVFEINLTEWKRLSSEGLRITRMEPGDSGMTLVMEGFDPCLAGRSVCLGLTRRDSIRTACRMEQDAGASEAVIESKLQRLFLSSSPSSSRMDQLMNRTIWVRSDIEAISGGMIVKLHLPPVAAGLIMRSDYGAILLVG